jgi:hypothetical protein
MVLLAVVAVLTGACIAGSDTEIPAEEIEDVTLETANNLNYCCFKCTGTGEIGLWKVFGGQNCQIVANNRCQEWGYGTGYQAHQCANEGW